MAQITPDLSGPLAILRERFGTPESREAERIKKEKADALQESISVLGDPTATPQQQEESLIQIAATNPQKANAMREVLERGERLELEEVTRQNEKVVRQAALVQSQPDFAGKQAALTQLAQEAAAAGEDVTDILELSNLPEPQLNLELQKMMLEGTAVKSITDKALEGEKVATAKTAIGKANEDLAAGLITEDQADAIIAKETQTPQGRQSLSEKLAEQRAITLQDIELRKDDPTEQLKLEALEQNVEAKAAAIQANKETLKKAQGLKSTTKRLIDELLEDKDAIRAVVGPADQLAFTVLPSSLRAETKINQISSILTADNLNLMTGVLSETDLKILAAVAGGGLNVGGDDEAFIKELERMSKSLGSEESIAAGVAAQEKIEVDF